MLFRRGLKAKLRSRVIVQTRDGKSIQGVLVEEFSDSLVLDQPQFLTGTQPQDLGGQVVVLLDNISWVQLISS